jgi:hypothetical protein
MSRMITAVILVLMTASIANAGSWVTIEKPCGNKCPRIVTTYPDPNDWARRTPTGPVPTAEIRSQAVINSSYGTSVINSTYRSYQ